MGEEEQQGKLQLLENYSTWKPNQNEYKSQGTHHKEQGNAVLPLGLLSKYLEKQTNKQTKRNQTQNQQKLETIAKFRSNWEDEGQ